MNDLVSIIIPTYNRAHLIGETFESVLAQTYKNFECIVVDDGSNDYTNQLLEFYAEKDARIKYFPRPTDQKKGANSCRNFGFEKSTGDYIIWFDSDDLMTPDHISAKLDKISESHTDFIVARTQNFQDGKLLKPYQYVIKDYGIKVSDFILLKIHWYTYDVMLKRHIAQKIEWNDKMKSWQDYNYFCKMLLYTDNGIYLNKVLTHRRLHENSIQKKLNETPENFREELLENRLLTYYDINTKIEFPVKRELIYGMMNLCFEIGRSGKFSPHFYKVVVIVGKAFGFLSRIKFLLAVAFARLFKKGNFMLENAKARHKYIAP